MNEVQPHQPLRLANTTMHFVKTTLFANMLQQRVAQMVRSNGEYYKHVPCTNILPDYFRTPACVDTSKNTLHSYKQNIKSVGLSIMT